MSQRARLELIERNTAEIMGRDELPALLDSGLQLRHYIGYEISGKVHLGGVLAMAKVHDLAEAGVHCSVLLADWHTWINDKLGGDREAIRRVATGYFAQGLGAALTCVGGHPEQVELVLASDLYRANDDYWATVIDVSKSTTLARMQRSISIMGRQEGESIDFAKLIYPAMQVADIFAQGVHIAHAGLDQRKAHAIARDVALQLRVNALRDAHGAQIKPVALHHPLLLGLRKPPVWPVPEDGSGEVFSAMKMSKSDPGAAVFVHDTPDEIRDKLRRAFAPPNTVQFNPVLDWIEKLVFGISGGPFHVERTPQNGGAVSFDTYEEAAQAYGSGALHPMDAKNALAERLIDLL
ncbi:MAG TPA: tyrosine--tRNA ligase, partial [Candidatus Dormibacteraeota bacterium]|nr:tyrosine--tRNA ligase [Candidatus Dormibacteraeota bacterium]